MEKLPPSIAETLATFPRHDLQAAFERSWHDHPVLQIRGEALESNPIGS